MEIVKKGDYRITQVSFTLDIIVGYDDEVYCETPDEVIKMIERTESKDLGRLLHNSIETAVFVKNV